MLGKGAVFLSPHIQPVFSPLTDIGRGGLGRLGSRVKVPAVFANGWYLSTVPSGFKGFPPRSKSSLPAPKHEHLTPRQISSENALRIRHHALLVDVSRASAPNCPDLWPQVSTNLVSFPLKQKLQVVDTRNTLPASRSSACPFLSPTPLLC